MYFPLFSAFEGQVCAYQVTTGLVLATRRAILHVPQKSVDKHILGLRRQCARKQKCSYCLQ